MEVYEDIKEKLSEFGNNIKISYAVAKTLIEKKLREKDIIAEVKIDEDKNGNLTYIISPLDKSDKRNSKLGNSSGTNISKASSSNNSDKKNENKEENINKDDKGSEDNKDNKDNKEPNNEEKKPTPKNEDDSDIGLKIGTGTGAAYEIKSGIKNSNNKNTTSTAQENSNKNANPSNQRGQVSQSNKNNANKPKTEESNPDNQQANKIVTSNSQEEAPATKMSTNQGIKMGNLTVYKDYVIGEREATYKLRGLTINGDKYYENNDSKYVIKNDKLVKIEATQVAEKFPTGDEKYYGRSEIDILNEVNNTISNTEDKYKSQKSYYNRKEVPYGTKDSVRPEGRSDGLNRTIEVKNYDIDKNSSSMISKIVEQAKERDIHLPEGNTQEVYIDIRNQNVSLEKQEFIKNKIEKDSNGIIKKENIHFKK